MVAYFGARDTDLSRKGLFALANSFAAIYYIPFQAGMSLHFRFRFVVTQELRSRDGCVF